MSNTHAQHASSHVGSFNEREVAALISASPTPWWAAFVHLGTQSGLRVCEMLRLQWSDVNPMTVSVRVDESPFSMNENEEHVTLHAAYTPHQHRVVPIPNAVFETLAAIRASRPKDRYVFIPAWRVEQLWPRLVTGMPLVSEDLAPNLNAWFQMVQRGAHLMLANQLGKPLVNTPWPRRRLGALRETYAISTSRLVPPSRLKELLGHSTVRPVLRYYDLDVVRAERGAA